VIAREVERSGHHLDFENVGFAVLNPFYATVMRALVAGIHVFAARNEVVDGRDRPGHDGRTTLEGPFDTHYP